ncbi:MAG: hypothetical protein J6R79_06710 [Bacteroidaceae bacterium]|nr:hypothetical protein [Bacteroidaceae bacterium]
MEKILNNPVVKVNNGRVIIQSVDINDDIELRQFFAKKIPGRMFINKESDLEFDLYKVGTNPSTVQMKEIVGQVVVTRSLKAMKFALSLPLSMTKHQVVMAIYEQAQILAHAVSDEGLYERIKGIEMPSTNKAEESENEAA